MTTALARFGATALLTALAAASLSACSQAWEYDAAVEGYAVCDGADPSTVTLHYMSGPGVENATPRMSESGDRVTAVIHLQGSGSNPAVGVPATIEVRFDAPIAERPFVTVDDQPIPEVPC